MSCIYIMLLPTHTPTPIYIILNLYSDHVWITSIISISFSIKYYLIVFISLSSASAYRHAK